MFCLGGETSSCSGIGNINHRPQANVPDAVPMKRALYSLNPESGGDNINSEVVRTLNISLFIQQQTYL